MSIQRAGNGVTQNTSPEEWLTQGGLQEVAAEIVRTATLTNRVVALVEALTQRVEQLESPKDSPEVPEPQPEDFDLDITESAFDSVKILDEISASQTRQEQATEPEILDVDLAEEDEAQVTDMLRVSIPQPALLKALKTVCKALPRSSANPKLSDVKVTINESQVTVAATDGELWLEQTIPALTKGQGELLVVGRLFLETVKVLPKEDLILDFHDNALHIAKGGANCSVSATSVDDYPSLPRFDDALLTSMSCATLKRLLGTTLFASVKQSSTGAVHYTNGVLLNFTGEKLDVVATDGHRLVLNRCGDIGPDEVKSSMLIPAGAAKILHQQLPDDGDLDVMIYKLREKVFFEIPPHTTGKRVRTHHPATLISTSLIDVKFPPYERVIPKSFKTKAYLNKDELFAALKRTILVCRQKDENPVANLATAEGLMTITADGGEFGKAEEKLACEGGSLRLAINPEYLMDVLRVIEGDQVILNWQSEVDPVAVTTPRNPDFIYILMPIRQD